MKNKLIYLGSSLLIIAGMIWLVTSPVQGLDFAVDANICQQVKTRLKQIKLSDAVTRVNYGQVYESLSVNVMTPINLRLVANNLKPVELLTITDNYQKQFAQFRQNYVNYEEKLSQALELSCDQNPTQLISSLPELRQLRQKLNANTKTLRQLAGDYQIKFEELYDGQKVN